MEKRSELPAPLGELESDVVRLYHTEEEPECQQLHWRTGQFANDLDTFASSMNDFYGRDDEDGKHRMFTYKT